MILKHLDHLFDMCNFIYNSFYTPGIMLDYLSLSLVHMIH